MEMYGKHTVFGRVEKGMRMDVVQGIEKVKTTAQTTGDDKPLMDIKIISIVTMHTN